jgi:hypothetical protein
MIAIRLMRACLALSIAAPAAALLLGACTPRTPEQEAREAARSAVAAVEAAAASTDDDSGRLSPAELEEAKQGVLRGYREDATKLSTHYFLTNYRDTDYRLWLARAAATGSSLAIEHDVLVLSFGKEPGDCAEARALIAKAKTLYAGEIAAAKAKNLRDAKIEALARIREQEASMRSGACATDAGPGRPKPGLSG